MAGELGSRQVPRLLAHARDALLCRHLLALLILEVRGILHTTAHQPFTMRAGAVSQSEHRL